MLAEVSYGVVDTSIASFSLNLERIKLADFSQYIVSPIQTIVMKRPVKSEQISYYTRKSLGAGRLFHFQKNSPLLGHVFFDAK